MEDKALLFLDHVTKAYYSKNINNTVIKELCMGMQQSERIGITGPSGCGKTTLLKLIAGLERIDNGKIIINGIVVSDKNFILPPHKRGLGFVFQTPALWPHMTVEENVRYPSKGNDININELLEQFEVLELKKRYPSQISGGQAKRVAIARALASEAPLLLMDEPLTNLEKNLKKRILNALDAYLQQSKAGLIYVTHDEDELQSIVSRSYKMTGGTLYDA